MDEELHDGRSLGVLAELGKVLESEHTDLVREAWSLSCAR